MVPSSNLCQKRIDDADIEVLESMCKYSCLKIYAHVESTTWKKYTRYASCFSHPRI